MAGEEDFADLAKKYSTILQAFIPFMITNGKWGHFPILDDSLREIA
jgi:hypothetical protein